MQTTCTIGLDLGQAQDYSALVVLERSMIFYRDAFERHRPVYSLRHLERFPLGTSYAAITERLVTLLQTPPLPQSVVGVDQTGVGKAVVDLIFEGLCGRTDCMFYRFSLSTGHIVTLAEDGSRLMPRKELVGVLQVLLQNRRLLIPRELPEAMLLVKELENFKARITVGTSDAVDAWREGQHDDMVLALGLAAWIGERLLVSEAEPPNWPPGVPI